MDSTSYNTMDEVKSGKQRRAEKKAERLKSKQQQQKQTLVGGTIEAFSQVSRFHAETLETLAIDVDLKQVCVNIGDRVILEDAPLRLFKGNKYGLIGRNGAGKSTLLKSIGYRLLVGFPTNIRVLYVEQLEGSDHDRSVIDVVLDSDVVGNRLRSQAKILESAIASGSLDQITDAVNRVNLEQAKAREEEAREIANKRSGARGATARRVLNDMEELTAIAQEKLDLGDASENLDIHDMLDSINEQLRIRDADTLESNARKFLKGLGFTPEMQNQPLKLLSGGWKIRAALASALLIQPDVLLLDEPTNHLDLPAIIWLQDYLSKLQDITVVIVSHDRAFLNTVTNETIVMKDTTLKYYSGNYDEYLAHFTEKQEHLKKVSENIEKKRSQAILQAKRNMVEAKRSGDAKKMQQSASKQRKAEEMGTDKNELGFKFKRSRDMAGYHHDTRLQVELEPEDVDRSSWKFPDPTPLRNANDLAKLDSVTYKYPNAKQSTLTDVTLNIPQGARIGIVGANGQGKSTLVKLICGEISPQKGDCQSNSSANVAYFGQQHIDRYHQNDGSPVSLIMEQFSVSEHQARNVLGRFGVKGDTAVQPLKSLSGGQMMRVAFAVTVALKPAHFLVLDEPTNHLDFGTIESLIESLNNFSGGVLIVSHDQHFIEATTSTLYMVKDGSVTQIPSVHYYVEQLRSRKGRKKQTK